MEEIIKDVDFKNIMQDSIGEAIEYFLDKELSFGVLCNIASIEFEPKLSDELMENFQPPFTFFVLANYTLESARVEDDFLLFEAGFGENDFASVVKVPLYAIFQIVVDEKPIFINMCATVAEEFQVKEESEVKSKSENTSINAILSNPENQKLLKKLKK